MKNSDKRDIFFFLSALKS